MSALRAKLTGEEGLQLGAAVTRWSREQTDLTRGDPVKGEETSNSQEETDSCWDSSEISEGELDLYAHARWSPGGHWWYSPESDRWTLSMQIPPSFSALCSCLLVFALL